MSKPTKIYWDTCAWLGLINGETTKKRELEIIYQAAKKDRRFEIWTSTLSLVEANRVRAEEGKPKPLNDENEKLIADIFAQPFIKPISLDFVVASNTRKLARTINGLSYKDAVHIASAQWWDIETLHTYDRADLLDLSGKLDCRSGAKLKICYPDETTDGPLFAQNKKEA